MNNESIIKLLMGSREDQAIAIEILITRKPRLTREIIGVIYAHLKAEFYYAFEPYNLKRARLLPDRTNTPDITRWSIKYKKK